MQHLGSRTLWMGGIPANWTEEHIAQLFPPSSQLVSVKVVRNMSYPDSFGYAFLNFASHESARHTLLTFNNAPIPATQFVFRLNWGVMNKFPFAAAAAAGVGKQPAGDPYALFVGDIPPEVNDEELLKAFHEHFAPETIVSAHIVTDPARGGVSKGFGFVKFAEVGQSEAALKELDGQLQLGQHTLRVRVAQQRNNSHHHHHNYFSRYAPSPHVLLQVPVTTAHEETTAGFEAAQQQPATEENTTVFVGNLSSSVTLEQLQAHFAQCTDTIVSVKILPDKSCGFVRFATNEGAKQAIELMQGTMLNGALIRLNWGRKQYNDYATDYYPAAAAQLYHHHGGMLPPPPYAILPPHQQQHVGYFDASTWQEYQQSAMWFHHHQQQQHHYMYPNAAAAAATLASGAVGNPTEQQQAPFPPHKNGTTTGQT